jgi:hypothetical protein
LPFRARLPQDIQQIGGGARVVEGACAVARAVRTATCCSSPNFRRVFSQADDGDRVVEWGMSGRIAGGQGCNLLFRACLAQSL